MEVALEIPQRSLLETLVEWVFMGSPSLARFSSAAEFHVRGSTCLSRHDLWDLCQESTKEDYLLLKKLLKEYKIQKLWRSHLNYLLFIEPLTVIFPRRVDNPVDHIQLITNSNYHPVFLACLSFTSSKDLY